MLDKEQTDLDNALKVLGNEGLEEDEKSYFITSLCWVTQMTFLPCLQWNSLNDLNTPKLCICADNAHC